MSIDILEWRISDWNTFERWERRCDFAPITQIGYVFRGQARADWPLRPSLGRECDAKPKITEEQALELEKCALADFQERAHLHLATHLLPHELDAVGWWALMRHYGAPTRMLDWTSSTYVAAYFAAIECPDEDGVVWAVHPGFLLSQMSDRYDGESAFPSKVSQVEDCFFKPSAPPVLFLPKVTKQTERMVAQRGLFSVCRNILGDHGEIMADNIPNNKESVYLARFILPASLKPEVLRRVRAMNITANSLFPGADGLGRSVSELVKLALCE